MPTIVKELLARIEPVSPSKSGTVTVSGKPSVEIPPGTLNSVLKQAGRKK